MTDNCDLYVEVRDQDLVVTMPGTSLRVVYRKPHWGSQLVARLDYFQDQQKGPITRAEFIAKALKLANDKARELGWIARVWVGGASMPATIVHERNLLCDSGFGAGQDSCLPNQR
jgi:hypothetical protein